MEPYDKGVKPTPTETKPESSNNGRLWAGLVVVAVGLLVLARQMDVDLPHWIFSWEMIVIGIALFVGAKQSFKPGGWLIAIAVGAIFLTDDYLPQVYLRPYVIPIVIIGIGLYIIFKPKRRDSQFWRQSSNVNVSSDELFESVSIFGSQKNIISKDFKGGEIVTIFGGSELNMTQADINGVVTLEVVQIFGGTKLIVPANWRVQSSEVVSVFGSVEDKRPASLNTDSAKVLNIKGASVFGGIDIRSY